MPSKVLVVGSGVLGLRTALELLRKNIPIVLRSSHPPIHPSTCSFGAGGLWMPYKCNDPRIDKWSIDTLDELLLSISKNKTHVPIEIVPTLYLKSSHLGNDVDQLKKEQLGLPEWTKDQRLSFQFLTIEMLCRKNQDLNLRIPSEKELLDAGYTHTWLFYPPVVDPPSMLMSMLKEIQSHPLMNYPTNSTCINMETKYDSLNEMIDDARDLGCDAIVNCTGLGAAHLCGDSYLFGGRGALLHYDRSCPRRKYDGQNLEHDSCILTEEGEWGTSVEPCYLIPRGNVLVVGGSYKEQDQTITIDEIERKRLGDNAWKMGIDTDKVKEISEWIGWRPCRPTVRVEMEENVNSSVRVVHAYGVGGSGWTVFAGVAKEAVKLIIS